MAERYRVAHSFRASTGYVTNGGQDAIDAMPDKEREHHIERGNLVTTDAPAKPISAMDKAELLAEAAARGLDVTGSGADGAVLVKDLKAALEDTEE